MWWADSKGAANQLASKVQNRQHQDEKKNEPILRLGAFGPSKKINLKTVIEATKSSIKPFHVLLNILHGVANLNQKSFRSVQRITI